MRSLWGRLQLLMTAGMVGLMPSGRVALSADLEDSDWNRARAAGSVEAYQTYLDRYPGGRYASDAFVCIVALTDVPMLAGFCADNPVTAGTNTVGSGSIATATKATSVKAASQSADPYP